MQKNKSVTFSAWRASGVSLGESLYVKVGLVVVSELSDEHRVIAYLVDEAMLIIDAPRPIAR